MGEEEIVQPTDSRARLLNSFEQATELPLLLLALAMIPLLLVPVFVDLSPAVERVFLTLDWVVWVAFAFEYSVRLALVRQKWRFVRTEWPDLLIIVLPFLRPLRIVRSARALRLLRLTRLAAFIGVVEHTGGRLLRRHKLHYAVLAALALLTLAALLVHTVEGGGDGNIQTLGDAFWWAIATTTTVGYGDAVPVTPAGRSIAALLMLMGIALFGVVTANLAAFLVEQDDEVGDRTDEILARLDELATEVQSLRNEVRRNRSQSA